MHVQRKAATISKGHWKWITHTCPSRCQLVPVALYKLNLESQWPESVAKSGSSCCMHSHWGTGAEPWKTASSSPSLSSEWTTDRPFSWLCAYDEKWGLVRWIRGKKQFKTMSMSQLYSQSSSSSEDSLQHRVQTPLTWHCILITYCISQHSW